MTKVAPPEWGTSSGYVPRSTLVDETTVRWIGMVVLLLALAVGVAILGVVVAVHSVDELQLHMVPAVVTRL